MMRSPSYLWLVCLVLSVASTKLATARCTQPDFSAQVPEFRAARTSRVNALLRFGEAHDLCFGIEYVDTELLTEVKDFDVKGGPVARVIGLILGKDKALTVNIRQGVIEISRAPSGTQADDIFSYVLPGFDARRGSLQEISNLLAMQLVSDLMAPEVHGFAGSYSAGDLKDQIGPLSEHNRSLRYLLNEIIFQSKGGAWITRLPWELRTDFTVPRTRQVWTILEYGAPSSSYDFALRSIATELARAEREQH